MRRLTLLMAVLAFVGIANAEVFLEYEMGDYPPTFTADGFTGGDITAGAGANLISINASLGYPTEPVMTISQGTASASIAEAQTNECWFTFSLTMGVAGGLDAISLDAARGGGSSSRGFAIYASVNGGAEVELLNVVDAATARPVFTNYVTDLTGISSLQGLSSGDVITFKVPMYSINSFQTLEFDNIVVEGTDPSKASVPNPIDEATDIDYTAATTLSWNAGLNASATLPNPAITSHYLTLSIPYSTTTTEPNWLDPGTQTFTIDPDTNPVDGNVDAVASQNIGTLTPDSVYFWKVDEYLNGTTPPSSDPNVVSFGPTWSLQTATEAPTVEAGNSVVTWLVNGSKTINLDGTVTYVSPAVEDFTLWSVYNTPSAIPGDPNVSIANTGLIDTTATFTRTGQFALELYAKDTAGADAFDRIEVTIYADSCAAAQNNPNNPTFALSAYDFNNDCLVNLDDFALFAATWLDDQRLTADEYYDAGIISAPTITINTPSDAATVSGVVTIDATVYDDWVGTNDGDGIETVWVNIYQGTDSETGTWVAGNGAGDTAAPYTFDWDSVVSLNGVYTIRVSSQSLYGFSPEEINVTVNNP